MRKRDGAGPRDQQEPINEAQRIRLKSQTGRDKIDRTLPGRWQPGGLSEESSRYRVDVCIGNPVPTAYVQPKKIGVQLFALREKVAHVYGAGGSTKQANGVEVCGKGQDPFRFRQAPCEYALQNDASHQPYQGKGLSDADEQLGTIVVFCRPRACVLSTQDSRQGRMQPEAKSSRGSSPRSMRARL